jgi:hypothetical protein
MTAEKDDAMSKKKARKQPHSPLEDWVPALRQTQLDGAYCWVTNEDHIIVYSTPDSAAINGEPIETYIGSHVSDYSHLVFEPPAKQRMARLNRLMAVGGSDTQYQWATPPAGGVIVAVITTTRIKDQDTGRKYLLHYGHDVTDLEDQLDYLQAPAFQGVIMIIVATDGTCLAATDAAAKLVIGANKGSELHGVSIKQTPYSRMWLREKTEVEASRQANEPRFAVEWLVSAGHEVRPYAVARIAFPHGRWMIILLPIPLSEPWFQLEMDKMLAAENFQQPAQLSTRLFNTLVDMRVGLSLAEAAKRRGVKKKTIEKYRAELAEAVGVDSTKKIVRSLRNTELGYLAMIYSERVIDDG